MEAIEVAWYCAQLTAVEVEDLQAIKTDDRLMGKPGSGRSLKRDPENGS